MRLSAGPFTAGKCQVHTEEDDVYDGAAVFNVEGHPFCYVANDDIIGRDDQSCLLGAIARATRIAESLNKTGGYV